jgi:hypothetical protein
MFQFEINDSIVLQQQKVLEAALSTNPKTQKALQKLIDKVLKEAREEVVAAMRSNYKNGDPRGTAHNVRRIVYRKILGGNINILSRRKQRASNRNNYEPPRKLQPGQRGGNRVLRGNRTDQVMHYGPLDRWWIQYILEHGTGQRQAGTRNGRLSGNRGSIAPRSFFRRAAEPALMRAVDNLAALIDKELMAMIGNG